MISFKPIMLWNVNFLLAAHHSMFFCMDFLHSNLSVTWVILILTFYSRFCIYFVQYLFEAFTIVDFCVLLYHAFCWLYKVLKTYKPWFLLSQARIPVERTWICLHFILCPSSTKSITLCLSVCLWAFCLAITKRDISKHAPVTNT